MIFIVCIRKRKKKRLSIKYFKAKNKPLPPNKGQYENKNNEIEIYNEIDKKKHARTRSSMSYWLNKSRTNMATDDHIIQYIPSKTNSKDDEIQNDYQYSTDSNHSM